MFLSERDYEDAMLGLVRTDLNLTDITFRNGIPITLPHDFGNPVTWTPDPSHFGNPIPPPDPSLDSNLVIWAVDPAHFGNIISPLHFGILLLVAGSAVWLVDDTDILLVS